MGLVVRIVRPNGPPILARILSWGLRVQGFWGRLLGLRVVGVEGLGWDLRLTKIRDP